MQNLRLTDDEETSEPVTDPEESDDLVVLELVESAIDVPLLYQLLNRQKKKTEIIRKEDNPQ